LQIPTEQQFEEAISELQMSAELNHRHGNKEDGCCDMCSFCKEIDRRGREGNSPTQLDMIALSVIHSNSLLGILITTNKDAMSDLLQIVRLGCLVGYKVSRSEHGVDELEKMMEL
jgi:hypothetical protein